MSKHIYTGVHSSLRSGLTGGAATGHGTEYQTWYAVYLTLKLISKLLRENPLHRPMLVIEPRILANQSVTRWDIRTAPDLLSIEAKFNFSTPDLIPLLKRCRESAARSNQRFELVYGETSGGSLQSVEKLIRLAIESAGNKSDFDARCNVETDEKFKKILLAVGSAALVVGQRLTLKHMPEHLLHDTIDLHLQFLVTPSNRASVKNALFTKFLSAMKRRESFFVPSIVKELKEAGIEFVDPGTIAPQDIDPSLHKVLFFMQHCAMAVPIHSLAQIAGCPVADLQKKLEQTQMAAISKERLCTCNPMLVKLQHIEAPKILSDGLDTIIEFINANRTNHSGLVQVENAVALARQCNCISPETATKAFGPLNKLLKRSGKKRRVLEMAEIAINSARSISTPTESIRKAEAVALICGKAWVYQRMGQFDDAEAAAKESLELGESIGWIRNTAFCLKCMGRLRRVRAEHEHHPKRVGKLLSESRDLLHSAIDKFSKCEELKHIQRSEEVADCHSLLGRTELLAGRTHVADQCAIRARELMETIPGYANSKDYMDLLILEAEVLAKGVDYAQADKKFAETLRYVDPKDSEKSEIAARAHLGRGENLLKWKDDKNLALKEVRLAFQIWESLDEDFCRALAEWSIIRMTGGLTRLESTKLKSITLMVRVEMFRLLRLNQQSQSAKTLSQRAELNDTAWTMLHTEAKNNVAIRYRRW